MATSNTVEFPDRFETTTGEPTWDNPTEWVSVKVDWKPGTQQYAADQASTAMANLTTQVASARAQTQADRAAWAAASSTDRNAIMDRVFAGLENIIDALEALGIHLGVG